MKWRFFRQEHMDAIRRHGRCEAHHAVSPFSETHVPTARSSIRRPPNVWKTTRGSLWLVLSAALVFAVTWLRKRLIGTFCRRTHRRLPNRYSHPGDAVSRARTGLTLGVQLSST
jgi:hypothetical protein